MRKKLRLASSYLIVNLAVSDLLFALGIPFIAVTRIKEDWVFGDIACKLVTYVQFVCGVSSILTMMVMSVERYLCIFLSQNIKMSNTVIGYILFMTWLMSLSFPVPIALTQTDKHIVLHSRTYVFCGVSWERSFNSAVYLTMMFVLFFAIPLLVITVNYCRILRLVGHSAKRAVTNIKEINDRRQMLLLKMCIAIVTAFVLMWLPFFFVSFLGIYYNVITSSQFSATFIVVLANTSVNPIIYGYFNTSCKQAASCLGRKKKESECPQLNLHQKAVPPDSRKSTTGTLRF